MKGLFIRPSKLDCTPSVTKRFTTSDHSELIAYLERTTQIDPTLHGGILKALKSVYGNEVSVDNLKTFGPEGLKSLAASVEQQELKYGGARGKKRPSRKVTFEIPHHRTSFEFDWKKGDSLLDVAKESEELLGEYMEGTCGGNMSCCTCHVYLNDAALEHTNKAVRAENDMLDLAYEPQDNSRLGCQVVLQRELLEMEEPVIVTIPASVNNVW
eukprot:CAMPEP_0198144992 /NCGR_PEP_ID=MMETSP1443-20131203/20185_1 /TAXON_ID=186043 /ORGANISM="Entomoneis sp., Strain CCMP2396" /LENGTH=212 /DNA_ID=CAMNT_0043808501 /DNA_START=20 /DNA_END=655 /DNA_ORIENTATION=+